MINDGASDLIGSPIVLHVSRFSLLSLVFIAPYKTEINISYKQTILISYKDKQLKPPTILYGI
jgi:hypothetical protein